MPLSSRATAAPAATRAAASTLARPMRAQDPFAHPNAGRLATQHFRTALHKGADLVADTVEDAAATRHIGLDLDLLFVTDDGRGFAVRIGQADLRMG